MRYRHDLIHERERGEADPAEPASCRKYRPVIDRRYALGEIVEATRYGETGQKTGNVVLRVSDAASGEQPEPPRSTKRKCTPAALPKLMQSVHTADRSIGDQCPARTRGDTHGKEAS